MEAAQTYIVIRGYGAISPLGFDEVGMSKAYLSGNPAFTTITHADQPTPVATLSADAEQKIKELVASNTNYRQLDRSVLMAIYATQKAAKQAEWLSEVFDHDLAVNIGSSRGATGLFEEHYAAFQHDPAAHVAAATSPTTTLGNLSSWAAHAVNAGGAQISHSITCSSALMAIANAVAWLKAGMAKRFLAGGTEAPLTDFTIAQMKAVGIYSKLADTPFPCRPYSPEKQNTFVLGEGAAVFALEKVPAEQVIKQDIIIEAVGFGFEPIKSKTGISAEGLNFQYAMRHALEQLPPDDNKVDLIITHTPGTAAGDAAELAAIRQIFSDTLPILTNNKWLIGHTLGASGALSLAYALSILKHQQVTPIPFLTSISTLNSTVPIRRIMVNTAGFGGNASSLVITIF